MDFLQETLSGIKRSWRHNTTRKPHLDTPYKPKSSFPYHSCVRPLCHYLSSREKMEKRVNLSDLNLAEMYQT